MTSITPSPDAGAGRGGAKPRSLLGRRAAFFAVAYAYAVAMLGTTLPTPLYRSYQQQCVGYLGISVPVAGVGLLTELASLRVAGLVFAGLVALLALAALYLLAGRSARRRRRPRPIRARTVASPGPASP
jgi:hypothetical protein